MANSWRVVVYASFLMFLLLTGCVTVIRPKDQTTLRSGSVNTEVGFRSQVCAGTFKAVLDGNNVTGQFSQLSGSQVRQATLTNLAIGPHTLIASADTLQWWFLIPYCGGSSATTNFCVAEETSLSTPSKTAFLNGNGKSWTKTSDTTIGVAVDAGALATRWNLNRIGGAASNIGWIQSTENSCLCMRSMDDKENTPIGLVICDKNDKTQQWTAIPEPPFDATIKTFHFQNSGRGISDACLTAGQNDVLIQRACNGTSDQKWAIRNNTNMQFVTPFFD